MGRCRLVPVALAALAGYLDAAPMPEAMRDVFVQYCTDCHDAATNKGGVNLDHDAIDWTDPAVR